MKELKTLKVDSDFAHFMECYTHNKSVIGTIAIRQDVYDEFIKILSAFPLRDNKLEYFLNLDAKMKCGYMSKYIMKIARKIGIPKIMIEQFAKTKKFKKLFETKTNAKEIATLFSTDFKNGLLEYKYTIKYEIYSDQLLEQTLNLCSAIFEQFDKARIQMLKEQQL